jgi:hypothetical protein
MQLFINGYAIAMPPADFFTLFLDAAMCAPGYRIQAIDLSLEYRDSSETLFKCYPGAGSIVIETEDPLSAPLFSALMARRITVLQFSAFDNVNVYGCAYYSGGEKQLQKIQKPDGLTVEKDTIKKYAALSVRQLVLHLIEEVTGEAIETIMAAAPQTYILRTHPVQVD